jgi:tryptophan synthase alpha chain
MSRSGESTGIERIDAAFAAAREESRAALMPYLVGGFPDLETSRRVAHAYAEAGADLIELGVPYSDPLADGPVIHAAATDALNAGATFAGVLSVCADVTAEHPELPVLPMVYANMALAPGAEGFASMLADAGAAGAIVPDLPPGEDADLPAAMADRGLALVPLVAPTTTPERRRRLVANAQGFIYVVSLTGVTGEREALPEELTELVAAVREEAGAPAAVGFGIGTPERAAEIGAIADGVIIGSRLVRAVADAVDGDDAVEAVTEFLGATRTAMSAPGSRPVG